MFLFRFSFVALALFLFACTSTKNNIVDKDVAANKIDPSIAAKVKGSGDITLLEHQLLPIDYMHKNPDLKGILVNHYMGTGKTYLGIGFAQSYPDRPVIILAPRFLESHWRNQIKEYGATNPKRFTFVSYKDAPTKLANADLSNHILLADEIHNLVKKMRSLDSDQNARYTKVYSNLRNAYKIIGLTGTPIYGDESDLAFVINLVSGKDIMPYNKESFRLEYTKILGGRQFFRGYLSESNLLISLAPVVLGFSLTAVVGPLGILAGLPIGIFTPVLVNGFLNPATYKFRKLNVDKMQPVMTRYISYFKFDDSHFKDFPAQDYQVMNVSYNRPQYSFFLHLVEGDLPVKELQRLLSNESVKRSDEFVSINSTSIHEQIYSITGAGRDIGNFEFKNRQGEIEESPKFLAIHEMMKENNEQTVVYSNYYETGILAFRDFLNRQGFQEKYAIIEPSLTVSQVNEIVRKYNNEEIKVLMLHPEITEGISLKGTQYMHILEPMLNSTVLEQVVGRTRRFQSHSHLPKDKQVVNVRMWQSTSSTSNPDIGDIRRANWYKRYRELSFMSRWGIGVSQVDKNYHKKALNPEELASLKLETLKSNLLDMRKLLQEESIENLYHD